METSVVIGIHGVIGLYLQLGAFLVDVRFYLYVLVAVIVLSVWAAFLSLWINCLVYHLWVVFK